MDSTGIILDSQLFREKARHSVIASLTNIGKALQESVRLERRRYAENSNMKCIRNETWIYICIPGYLVVYSSIQIY